MGPLRWKWLAMEPEKLIIANIETPEEFTKRFYPVGQTFHHEIDREPDLWHIVGYMDERDKKTGALTVLVVYKRWSRRYQEWRYASDTVDNFIDQQIDLAGYDLKHSYKQPVRGHLKEVDAICRQCQELINKETKKQ